MTIKHFLFVLVLMFVKTVQSEEAFTYNVSCCFKNNNSKFKHGCINATEMEIYDKNKTMMAYVSLNKLPPNASAKGIIIDNASVTIDSCQRPLTIKCITKDEKRFIKETYIYVEFIAECGSDENTGGTVVVGVIWGLSLGSFIFIVGLVIIVWYCWKEKEKNNSERSVNSTKESSELEDVISDDVPPQQRSPNGFRKQGDDPGGTHGSERTDSLREGVKEWPDLGQEPEDGQTEGQPLLSDLRAAGFERMGEAEDSVNEQGFDPVSLQAGRRPEPKSGVESRYTEENL